MPHPEQCGRIAPGQGPEWAVQSLRQVLGLGLTQSLVTGVQNDGRGRVPLGCQLSRSRRQLSVLTKPSVVRLRDRSVVKETMIGVRLTLSPLPLFLHSGFVVLQKGEQRAVLAQTGQNVVRPLRRACPRLH